MSHILEPVHTTANLMNFEHLQQLASIAAARVEVILGADEAKQFQADVAKCVSGNEDVASRGERLRETFLAMHARMNAQLDEKAEVTRQLKQQLQACTGITVGTAESWSIDNLSDGAKQTALTVALKLAYQFTRELGMATGNNKLLEQMVQFASQEKTIYLEAMDDLAAFADATQDSLDDASARHETSLCALRDYANERTSQFEKEMSETRERYADALRKANDNVSQLEKASARYEDALRTATGKIAQLEKDASQTSERIAQVVHDVQKLTYKKEDPDRPTWSKIQQKPLECLERMAQALKRASEAKGADEDAPGCTDCQALTAKLETLQKETNKLLEDKKALLEDRQRDKDEVERLTKQEAKLRADLAAEKPKKRKK
ncbi:hypothetical protein AAVH_10012 [Aphelenchoides avenae]|nr:hypothetical protein AAVH_10012 [Aphelenchus avenae]